MENAVPRLVRRKYKESNEPLSSHDTGWAAWVRFVEPEDTSGCGDGYVPPELPAGCPVYSWDFRTAKAMKVPSLEGGTYVGTLSYPGVKYAWVVPELREGPVLPDCWVPEDPELSGKVDRDLYFVYDGKDWDLYSVSGGFAGSVYAAISTGGTYFVTELYLETAAGDPEFSLVPPTYYFTNNPETECLFVGEVEIAGGAAAGIVSVDYDGDDGMWKVEREGDSFLLFTMYTSSGLAHEKFEVPLVIRYVDSNTGMETETRETFTVHGFGAMRVADPYVKYVRNMASRVGTSELVTVLGGNFTEDMSVRISSGGWSRVIPPDMLAFGEEAPWQKISFIFDSLTGMTTDGQEDCAVYSLEIGYGDDVGFMGLAGTGDPKMALENNVGLIRYKFDADNAGEQKKASAGAVVSTNRQCFYTSEIEMVYDPKDSSGNAAQAGGAGGTYGKTMYVKLPASGEGCDKIRYVHVKVKYDDYLPVQSGEMTLNGVKVTDGDVVWLAGQTDGTEGLWVVREGDWEGLADIWNPDEEGGEPYDPCLNPERHPLPVDGNVFVDLGARVKGSVDVRCGDDVPVKYGTQRVCGRTVVPGDRVLLANQADGKDGLWEVTCTDWIYLGAVADDGTTEYDASDDILYQNDIDFCTCTRDDRRTVYNIEYYYLNAGCYLAKSVRKVKLICAGNGSLVPNNRVVITDYSITAGSDASLIVDTGLTAGDPVAEDCTRPADTFARDNSRGTVEVAQGCGELGDRIVSPVCTEICDCPRFYGLQRGFDPGTLKAGFSMVFWQLGEGGWHFFAYCASRAGGTEYYVYHLKTCGKATVRMVDENTDVYLTDRRGLPTGKRTKDAWFVEHNGVLADGFGMYDENWKFVIRGTDPETGEDTREYTGVLGPDTLYQAWSLHGPSYAADGSLVDPGTRMLAHLEKVYIPDTDSFEEVVDGMEHVYGFRFMSVPLTKERFVELYNSAAAKCACQDSWTGLVTDQCYDSEGYEIGQDRGGCESHASEGPAFIATDDERVLEVERTCYDESGKEVDCGEVE